MKFKQTFIISVLFTSLLFLGVSCSQNTPKTDTAKPAETAATKQNTPKPAAKALSKEEQAVANVYKKILKREADPGGLKDWSTALKNNKITLKGVYIGLGTSQEYHDKFVKGKSPEQIAQSLYRHFAQNKTDQNAINQLSNKLKQNPASWTEEAKKLINTNSSI